uniref:CBM20 domain-containing protein n=1 Tax=Chromera velia CCMP2878 TaxID=1169474 RepID=A0A0G4F709_9ALVE|eukprot:Cvel_15563.t1-p1 / transcript=Cvel_15563.t1 / gene=Cvel_15563 / organism=Chromera_velia_CCMP2878 / gene_product=Zinc finger protein 283, putative / transcript_product=Zinc finger protein 283, putative / location=Cvel_scaffold1157:12470-14582(-) / protein_length=611 / sequence_SO=supercontig / SO=protein_coding / is_pseudo=false
MKRLVAFVVHCPELPENQRVVVVGECAELGGWELGGVLSLRPAPCGRPLWVSSEVEVDLSESPFGGSGVSADAVGVGGEVGGVRESELKFRLVAVPNEADAVTVPAPLNLICLEPLKGGDFRVVRLVDGVASVGSSWVGERGVSIVYVGAKGGPEQDKTEVVGISVEWGIPESVQLALLALHPQRESEDAGLHGPQSETGCPPSAQRRARPDSRMFIRTDESEDKSGVSVCHHESTVKFTESPVRGGRDGGIKRPCETIRPKKQAEAHVCSDSPDAAEEVCIRPSDLKSHNRILPSPPSNSSHLHSHDRTCDRRHEAERQGTHSSGVALKRQRETAMEGVSVNMDGSAAFARTAVGRASVSTAESVTLARSVEGGASVSTAGSAPSARTAVGRASVSMVAFALSARSAEGRASVSTAGSETSAKSVEGRVSVSMADGALSARSAVGRASASTAEYITVARSVEERVSVSMVAFALSARSAEGRAYVSTVGSEASARSAEGRVSVSMADSALSARSAEGRASVSTVGCALSAKSVWGEAFVSTAESVTVARSVEERVSVSMVAFALSARSASVCEHGRLRYFCRDCGGKGICVHRKNRRCCKECKSLSAFHP